MAIMMARAEAPFIFRNHEATALAPDRSDMLAQINQALMAPETLPTVKARMGLWMRKAEYGATLKGHYGLNVVAYAHTTSPIRRYVDLINQRLIKAQINGAPSPYTHEEVAAIARDANAWRAAREAERQEAFKEKAHDADRSRILHVGSFQTLTSDQFTKLIKRAIADDMLTPEFEAEIQRRLAIAVGPQDLYLILFRSGAGWEALREAAYEHVKASPGLAISAINALVQTRQGAFEGITHRLGEQSFVAQAKVVIEGRTMVTPCGFESRSKRQAACAAAVAWVRGWLDGTLKDGPVQDAPPDRPAPVAPALDLPSLIGSYVSALKELGDRGAARVAYAFSQRGPAHDPTFHARCEVTLATGVITGEATAKTKKEAKELASKDALEQIP
jgi:ribonuclease R